MPQLTERTDIYRMVGTYDGGKTTQAVYTRVPCLRVPISSFDQVAAALVARTTGETESFRSEGRSSTDLFLLPDWVNVQIEDELRRGRRTDITGAVVPFRYTVDGVRDYEGLGYQNTVAVFCTITQ
jgi:hypothetical protein